MPKIDGWEFLEMYKKLKDFQKGEIVIVMLTVSLNPENRTRAEDISEISDFKNKPISIEILGEIMQKLFPDYHYKKYR
jgi:CheY-like chemotaxis protein